MSDQSAKPEDEQQTDSGDLYVPLKGESAIDYIAIKTEQMVTAKMAHREAKYHRNLSIIFSLAGLVGLGAIATVVQLTMDQAINTQVRNELAKVELELQKQFAQAEDRIAQDAEQIRNTLILQDLALTIQAAELKDEIGRSELDEILGKIELIAGNEDMASQEQFATIIGKITVALADQGELESLGNMHRMLGPRMLENKQAAVKLGNYFGFIIVSEIVPPNEQPDEFKRVTAYLDQTRRFGYPEDYLFWNLLIELKNNDLQPTDRSDNLMDSAASLSQNDLKYFVRKIDTYAEVLEDDNARERETAVIAGALVASYGEEIEKLRASLPAE